MNEPVIAPEPTGSPPTPAAPPSVCFVILNWNQWRMTLDCLDSLASQSYRRCHIIVVDNGSTDGSAEAIAAAYPEVEVIASPENLGYSDGNNLGIRRALALGHDYVFLLNNDTFVDPEMLGQLVAEAEADPSIGAVGPTMYCAEPPDLIWGGDNWIDWRRGRPVREGFGRRESEGAAVAAASKDVDYIDTCAILIRRRVLEQVGGLDSAYFINFDDLDWNTRARRAGYRIRYVPGARMWHRVSVSMGVGSPATTYYMTRNELLFFWRHGPAPWRYIATGRIALRALRTVAAWTLKPGYRANATFRRRRDANVMALRDFCLGRLGPMGPDVARLCRP